MGLISIDDHLAGARSRVVIRAHRERIRAACTDGEKIARGERKIAVVRKEIPALAHWSYDLITTRRFRARAHRLHRVPGVVESGSDEVVHRCIDNREVTLVTRLQVQHPGQQHAGIADEPPARFEQQRFPAAAEKIEQHRGVIGHCQRHLVVVANPESATAIDVLQHDAAGSKAIDQIQHFDRRFAIGRELGDLRADVDVDAPDGDVRKGRGTTVERPRVVERDAEFAFLEARGDVRVSPGIDVRIDA